MHIKTKLYPYPVLADFTHDYLDSKFDAKVSVNFNEDKVIIKIYNDIVNDGILKLISDGLAQCIVHIESPATSFRKIMVLTNKETQFEIKAEKLEGLVSICPFIVAIKDINNYSNDKFCEDYDGISFDIERGNLIAIGKEFQMRIDKQDDELVSVPSIFGITEIKDKSQQEVIVDMGDSKKLYIRLPSTSYEEYKLCKDNQNARNIFFSMICIPAIMQCIEKFKEKPSEMYFFEDKRWYRALKKAISKKGIELSEETISTINSFELAQKIMDFSTGKAFYDINHLSIRQNTEEE